ncbi:hypothetical protein [Nonomuraea sp. NPDC049480]|uniref:hypothetical protein n=1 Tax=Nonomuraea sp. NPDC049480 TaxID=3364353 RepID=UPI0037B2B737
MPRIVQTWDAELGYSQASIEQRPDGGRVDIDPATFGAEPMWGIWMTGEDGSTGVAIIPHAVWEVRAAEYGIDSDDWDTLTDVVLHEIAIPHPGDPYAGHDPGREAVLEAIRDLPTVDTPGVSETDLLAAHLERIRLVKEHRLHVQPAAQQDRQGALDFVGAARTAPPNPLAPIYEARLDPIRIAAKKMALGWARENRTRSARPSFHAKPAAMFVGAGTTGEKVAGG